jgi:hypothetical protein
MTILLCYKRTVEPNRTEWNHPFWSSGRPYTVDAFIAMVAHTVGVREPSPLAALAWTIQGGGKKKKMVSTFASFYLFCCSMNIYWLGSYSLFLILLFPPSLFIVFY